MNSTAIPSRLWQRAAAILLPLLLLGALVGACTTADAPPTPSPVAITVTVPATTTPAPAIAVTVPATATPAPADTTTSATAPEAGTPPASAPTAPATSTPVATPAAPDTATPSALPAVPAATAPPASVPAPGTPTASASLTPTPLPAETPQPGAWLHRATAHYDLYYLPGSPAAHDSDLLAQTAEDALATAAATFQAPPTVRIRIYFVNRIFWQGGASYSHNELLISYPARGREYTSTSLVQVLRHETTHALVEQLLGSDIHKGGLLGEGVAVWAAGGHYQAEPLDVLAATLVGENAALYLPLSDLRRDFYGAQHELAYLEGGAFVKFLIGRWGLPKFKQYLDHPDDPAPIYGQSAAALEATWRAWLATVPHTAADSTAVRLRVRYYDLMRRYETTLDPDARILPGLPPSAWGPALIGLFSHPAAATRNVSLEQEFVRAGTALWNRDLATCTRLLDDLAAHF